MKLIIDIPEEIKAVINNNGTNEFVAETLWQAVKDGIPLEEKGDKNEICRSKGFNIQS